MNALFFFHCVRLHDDEAGAFRPGIWSRWDMLQTYLPIYEIALLLQKLRSSASLRSGSYASHREVDEFDSADFKAIIQKIQRECPALGLMQPAEIPDSIVGRQLPETYRELNIELTHLINSLSRELKKGAVFRHSSRAKMLL